MDKKYVELTQSIGAQFTALRAELGTEFDSSKNNAAKIRTLVTGFEEQKRTMIVDIEKHFRDFAVKSGGMREFVGQSEVVLQQSLGQMNTLMDGSLRTIHLRFEQHDLAFREI